MKFMSYLLGFLVVSSLILSPAFAEDDYGSDTDNEEMALVDGSGDDAIKPPAPEKKVKKAKKVRKARAKRAHKKRKKLGKKKRVKKQVEEL